MNYGIFWCIGIEIVTSMGDEVISMEDDVTMDPVFDTKKARMSTLSSPMEIYKSYLVSVYLELKMPDYGKWPPLPAKRYIDLAATKKDRPTLEAVEDRTKALIYGNIDAIKRESNITFSDIAAPNEDGVLPRFVLVEGAPGVGKSTFAWEACRRWAKGEILKDYDLIVLVRLRDESIGKATCLEDLILYPDNLNVKQKVTKEITETGGKGVLLVLEGYDELPSSQREESSVFRDVINGYQLHDATILVTSQHWASQPFLLPRDTQRQVSQHIELLGFTKESIEEYIICMLDDSPSLLPDIKQYLDLYPHIHSMMYIPLNCAIVLEVYRYSKRQKSLIPKTMTELYSSLIQSLLLRHMYDLHEYKGKRDIISLNSLDNLPSHVKYHFDKLAKLAYDGIYHKNQQIMFSHDEMPNDLDSLGLMESSLKLYVDSGAKKSFNFLHLTIQEFLAAYHILGFSLDEQVKHFTKYKHTNNIVVVRFLAGLSPCLMAQHIQTHCGLREEIESIHWLFEAKLKPSQDDIHCFTKRVCDPFSSFVLGYLIANSNCHWDIHIEGHKETIKMFVCGISNSEDGHFQSSLTLHIEMETGTLGSSDIKELSSAPISVEKLFLEPLKSDSSQNGYNIITNSDIADFFDKLSKNGVLRIKHLHLVDFVFNARESEKIGAYLKNTTEVTSFSLHKCTHEYYSKDAAADLMRSLQTCSSLRNLTLHSYNNLDCAAVANMLEENTTLTELKVSGNAINFWCKNRIDLLANALCMNSTLKKLDISENYFVKGETDTSITKMLHKNKTLKQLKVSKCRILTEGACMIASALCVNSTLAKLDISENYFGYGGAKAIAEMLIQNKGLEKLTLSLCSISTEVACMIANALCVNSTLQSVDMSGNHLELGGTETFVHLLEMNKTLRKLNVSSCRIPKEGICMIANVLCDNDAMECLDIYGNEIGTQGEVALAKMLKENKTLKELNISNCSVTTAGACMIASALCDNYILQELHISHNDVTVSGADAFATMLKRNSTLKKLVILGQFQYNTSQKSLDEYVNEAFPLIESLKYNTTLKELCIWLPKEVKTTDKLKEAYSFKHGKDRRLHLL